MLLTIASAAGCASSPDLRNLPPDALFQQGLASLQAEKWADAARAFERFSLEFVNHERYQESRFRLGEARFGAGDYVLAAADFARLQSDFPGGAWADDAQFKVCESYVELSPSVQLDQEYTQEALTQCQVLVAYYPASEHAAKAASHVVEMTDKLANKLYYVGDYYFRRHAYDPAIMYYELTVSTYPTSSYAPRALVRLIDTYRVLQYETEESEVRARLLRDYPQSAEARAQTARPDSVTIQ